jgi:hypothetical protein
MVVTRKVGWAWAVDATVADNASRPAKTPDKNGDKKALDMVTLQSKQRRLQPEFKTLGADREKQPCWAQH